MRNPHPEGSPNPQDRHSPIRIRDRPLAGNYAHLAQNHHRAGVLPPWQRVLPVVVTGSRDAGKIGSWLLSPLFVYE